MLPDIGLKRSTSVLTAKIVIVLSVLFLAAPSFAQTATDYVIYTGQAGAQTQIDAQHTSSWSISTSASVPSGSQFWGAQLTMKRGSSTTSTIKLTFYQGSSSAGTELGSVTLTPTPFTTQFNLVDFQLATPIVMQPNKQYYVTLTSPAPNVQSQAYFIKGLNKTAICPKNTTCNTSPAFTTITVNPVFETSKSILSVTRGGTALNISSGYTAAAGDVITYRVRVAESAGVGGSITLTESVPTNTSYSGTSEGWTGCSSGAVAGTTCTRSVTILARDATDNAGIPIPVDFNFTVTVGALTDGIASISNTVSASAGTCPTCTISSSTVPRLKISKTAPSSLPIGADAIYSLTVENKGGSSTSGVVTITDTLPTGLTFGAQTEGTPGLTCSASGQTVTCTGTPNLASNSSMTVSYRVDVGASATGTLVNSAIFTALGGDTRTPLNDATTPSAGNSTQGSDFLSAKSAQVATSVADPVVSKSLTAVNGAAVPSGYRVQSGDELRYTITLKNSGGSSASTTLTETVPANSTYLGPSEGWSCSVGAVAAATCTQAVTVSANSTATRTFTVKIGTLIDGILSISNQVQTSTGTCSSCTVTTSTAPRLQMSKSVPASLAPGESATYTLTIQNKGGSVTSGVVTVEDTLPVGLTFSAQTAGDPALVCAATGQKITCSGTPDLAVNATLTVSYRVDVSLTATGTLVNSALFTALGGDSRTPLDNASTPSSGTSAQGTDLLSAKSAQGVPSLKTVKTAATPSGLKVGDPINYTITVKNTGGVTITNVTVADSLNDRNGGVLTLTSGPTFSSGTNGATEASLPAGETLTYTASFTITQAVINAGGVNNTATASGKDPSNNTVSDQSDNGNDTDGNTTNDPTATNIVASPALDTVKTASTPNGVKVGDPINYTITVTNAGNVTITNVTVADTLTDAKGGALTLTSGPTFSTGTNGATAASLPPGETLTYTASFTITQAVINAGGVKNTATASGKDPANNTVSDQSDDGDDTDGNTTNDETVTNIASSPSLKTVKTATTTGLGVGDPINYTITVKNTGNVTITNVTVADTLTDAKGGALTLTSGPTFSTGTNGATAASLPPGETLTYTASFTITQAVINAGGVSNTATASGKDPANNTVSDQSDNGNDTDGNTTNDPTATNIVASPALDTVKTASISGSAVGDVINYTITVRNVGNVTLSGITVSDTMTDAKGGALTLTSGPTFSTGTNGATAASLPPGETLTYTASFTITQAVINAGGVKNTATANGKDPTNNPVSDKSDNGNDADGNTTNDDTVTSFTAAPSIKAVKTATTTGFNMGDPINYTITVKNTGNVTITNVTVADTLTDAKGGALALTSGPTFVSGTNGATAASLPPGETLTYTASFTITQAVINAGGVSNTATASGKDPANNTVSDVSDDGDNSDGNTTNDGTVTAIPLTPSLKTVKTASTPNGVQAGDPIQYTITVKNTGNVTLNSVTVTDTLTDAKGGVVPLTVKPTFVSGTNGATAASLPPGETLTYTANFTITQAVINAGGVSNTATASGKDPANNTVSDQSDNGNDTDGNTSNDNTVTSISAAPSLKTVKTATATGLRVGDAINYTLSVTNNGGVTLTGVVVADTLTDLKGGALALTSGPTFSSGTNGATAASLPPGETLTYTASFTITQAVINAGGVKNTATASGKDPANNTVSDQSDDGDDTDGNTTNDETVTPITTSPSLKTVKTATTPNGVQVGAPVNYTITVKNTGNVTVSNITIADTLTDAKGGVLSLTSGPTFSAGTNGATASSLPPGETLTYTASFTLTQAVINAGGVSNTATAAGKDPANNTVSDQSDNGNDTDGNSTNDPTITGVPAAPSLEAVKIATGTGSRLGDLINYTITVRNTGNVTLTGIALVDTLTDVNGAPLILSNGPTFSSGTNGATVDALPPGETLTFTAGFTITQAAINAGGVKNTVTVSGKDPAGQVVSDQSDNGNDSDGNTTNDPTITTIAGGPALKTVKTASFSGLGVGQPINYTITVKNTGNVTINNIMVVDTLTDAKGGPLALTSGPTWVGGSNGATAASLPPGETLTYTASVTITQAIINAGGVRNTATARGTDSASNTVSDRSDNGNDTDGNLNNDDTVTTITPVAALKAVKTATTTGLAAGEPINYTIAVKNIGNVPISNITVGDVLTDVKGAVLALSTGPTFSSGTNGATPALLPPGETLTYTASFTITQAVINAGGVRNTATVSGKDPANTAVSDVSDDGDDTDGNTANDQTVTPISVGPASLKTVKTATTTGVSVGDVVNYSITVKNTGGLTVSNIALNDTLTDAQGGALALTSGPTFTSGTNGATPVSLPPGETLTYNASFTITQAAINAGGLRNSATASGLDPSNNPVSDASDDGNDADGNTSNDETVTPIVISPSLKTVKTATSTGLGIGDVVNYLITVKNTGNVTVSGVTLADTLTDAQGGVLSLTSGPLFSSGTNGATAAALPPGETLTYTASFAVTQAVIDAGGLRNSATATGKDPAGTVVVDVSDNGDDSDGNTQNDVTVTGFPNLTLSKTSLGSAEKSLLAGSPTRYDIQVVNTGTAPTNGAVVLETIGKGLQLNSLGGAGWVCTYANGEPLTLPAKGPLTARCVTSAPVSAQGGKAVPISASVTPLPGFLGQRLTTEASVDPRGGNNPPPTGSSCQPSTACASNGGEVTPEALPTVGIAFASPSIPIGGQTRVTVTVVNKTGSPLTALNQSQVLPAGLVFVADPKATTNCNGSVSVVGGALVLSGGALPGGGSCTFSAIVSSSSPNGTKFTATVPVGAIKNAEKKTNEAAASADLLVEGNFAVRKSFQSSQGALGVPVKLTIVIDNTGTSTLSEVSLVDEFPVAPGKLTIADEPQIENTCSGTVTATPRAGRLSLSGGVVPRAGCSISLMVVADAVGDYLNVIPDGGSSGSPNGLRGKLPDGSALTSAPGASARVNIDRPAAVAGVFTKRTGFGTQVPQAGVTVVLKDAEGRVVATTVTKADGSYLFENLPPTLLGDATTKYRVEFIAPSAAGSTLIKGRPEADNPTVNGVADKNGIAGVTLLPGEKTPDQNGFLVDPSGVVYDAITRRPVAGARVTLIGPNGSAVPNSLLDTVAGTVNGAATGANGLYVLLLTSNASSGVYRLRVDVPSGYRAGTLSSSSALIPAEIGPYEPRLGGGLEKVQAQDVAPTLDQSTAYYMSVRFVIASFAETSSNGIINNHLPIDPVAPVVVGELQLTKVGAVRTAELGDSVGYTLSLTNATNIPQYGVVVTDALPRGFKYIGRTGALTRGGEVIRDDAALGVADGDRVMNFRVVPTNGFLRPGETVSLTYRVRVGVGSLRSDGINRAKAASRNGASSNEARFAVRVDGGVFGDEACVIGAVYRDCNGNGVQDAGEKGIAGARVYFSDGAFMVSDANGRYSMCGRSPTTQVLKVDTTTLPEGSVLLPTSNRNAGDPGSLFADLKNGELHRADFALACEVTPPAEPLAPKSAESPLLERTTPPAIVAPSDNRPPAEPKEPDAPTLCWDVMIEEVLFETDSAELTPASVDLLNAVITQWRGRRDIALEVRGHTDSVASDLYNIRLSARRARAVREFLLAGGQFDAAQLTESSYGESQPRDTNTTVEGRARNRRVAIRISGAYCKSGAPLNISAPSVTGGD